MITKEKTTDQNNFKDFDLSSFEEQAIARLNDGEELLGKNGILTPLIKNILEKALEGELESHLGYQKNGKSPDGNHRNGSIKKNVKTQSGTIELDNPRDRNGTFEPQLIKKRQTVLGEDLDNKIISLYSHGLSYRDITTHISDLYDIELSPATLTSITDKIEPVLTEWCSRSLEKIYPIIWMDAMFFKVKEEGKIVSKALYIVLGVNQKGIKEVLGFYLAESEGANFWLSVLTDLSNRGVKDILIACIDNLSGFAEAIESIYPNTEVQLCVIHQIRNSLKYIASKDKKEFMKDLKPVYKAATKELAEQKLLELEEKWGEKYPLVIKSWNNNWDRLSHYFKYPGQIRKMIYTTNIIEGLNRQIRKFTKSKGVFPNDLSLKKLTYLIIQNITEKWTKPFQNWSLTISQLAIIFEGRLELELNM